MNDQSHTVPDSVTSNASVTTPLSPHLTYTNRNQSSPRLVYLDGLRGFAALMVVIYHMWIGAGSPRWLVRLTPGAGVDLLSPVGALGGTRVSLFFVLSGFLLYLPFAKAAFRERCQERDPEPERNRRPAREPRDVTLRDWMLRRFRRLAPPYYAAIPLGLLPVAGSFYINEAWRVCVRHLPPRVPMFDHLFDAFPSCLFFMHGLFPGCEAPAFNGAIWTLTPEVQLYITFPLLIAASRLRGRVGKWSFGGIGAVVTVAVVASILYRVWLYREIGFAAILEGAGSLPSDYGCLANTSLGRLAEFAMGMGAAELVTRGRIPSPKVLIPVSLLCLVWFLILRSDLVVKGLIGQLFLAMDPAPSPLADAMGGVTFVLLILCCTATDAIGRLFASRALVKIGTLAYSLYLIHVPLLWCVHYAVRAALHVDLITMGLGRLGAFVVNILVIVPLAFAAAHFFWAAFERPFLSRERRVSLAQA